jgi:nitrite reductase/ring-hydroxylating ferredoxin subunit/hemerythrin-like domain-containing protein
MTAPDPVVPAPPAEGEMLAVEHEGSRVAVALLAGELHAFDDTCPHAGCSLAEGELEGSTVVCPCHMATFDVTNGEVVDGPAQSGIATWSVTVTAGALVLGEPRRPEPDGNDPGAPDGGDPLAAGGPDMDITVLVELEHDAIRSQFESLAALTDARELTAAWTTLAELLEIHASGEEQLLYPRLARTADEGVEEAEHAVREHNEIRDSVRAVERHPVGSEEWWRALDTAREVNEEHLQEEERDALPLFRTSTDRSRREELGGEWVTFHEQHRRARGLSGEDVDPEDVIPSTGEH